MIQLKIGTLVTLSVFILNACGDQQLAMRENLGPGVDRTLASVEGDPEIVDPNPSPSRAPEIQSLTARLPDSGGDRLYVDIVGNNLEGSDLQVVLELDGNEIELNPSNLGNGVIRAFLEPAQNIAVGAYNLIVSNAHGSDSGTVTTLKGDTGLQGEQGPAGPIGPAGATGARGPQGERGPVGATGAQGPQGERGPVGATGPKGDKGDRGEVGPRGPQGERGAVGATGPKGDQGDVGPRGLPGPKGDKGDRGDVGPSGPVGATGPAGPKGDRGDVGPQGPKGEPGWLSSGGWQSAVIGQQYNDDSTINNVALGNYSVVLGGLGNSTGTGSQAAVLGGHGNSASGSNSVVVGGFQNQASGYGSMAAGWGNIANSSHQTVLGVWARTSCSNVSASSISQILAQTSLCAPLVSTHGSNQKWVFVLGSGTGNTSRRNSFQVRADGIGIFAGDLYSKGSVYASGQVYSNGFQLTSDLRYKKNINGLSGAVLDRVLSLRPVSYQWRNKKLSDKEKLGFIAQEVEVLFPELIYTDEDTGKKTMDYVSLISPVVKAVQELYGWVKEQIHAQNSDIAALKAENESLKEEVEVLREGLCEVNPKFCK